LTELLTLFSVLTFGEGFGKMGHSYIDIFWEKIPGNPLVAKAR